MCHAGTVMRPARKTMTLQRGMTTVEFSIVGVVLFLILFGVIEFGRAMYVVNVLSEATRRGARLAAVCPVNDPYPAEAAVFNYTGGSASAVIPGMTTSNVLIEYLDDNGNVISDPVTNFDEIGYVRAQIVNFSMPLIIPILNPTLSLSGFDVTLPRESLGVYRVAPPAGTTIC